MVFKVLWNQCLQCCSFVVRAHRCSMAKRPRRPANTDHRNSAKPCIFVFEAVRLVSESKMTHELIKVHVPNIRVGSVQGWFTNCVFMFSFLFLFLPVQLFLAPLSKSCLKACIHSNKWCTEAFGFQSKMDFGRFLSFGVFVSCKVG